MKIDKKIEVQKVEDGKVSGVFAIRSSEDAMIKKLYIRVLLKATGRMATYTQQVDKEVIDNDFYLQMNQTIRMPFCIEFKQDMLSYEGENVTIQYGCQLCIQLAEHSFDKLDRKPGNALTRLIGMKNDGITTTDYFDITAPTDAIYHVNQRVLDIKLTRSKKSNTLAGIITLIIYLLVTISQISWLIEEHGSLFLIIPILLFSLPLIIFYLIPAWIVSSILQYSLRKSIEAPEIMVRPEQDGFKFEFLNDEFSSYKNPQIGYIIEEKVVDNRGSGTSTHTENIYESEVAELEDCYDEPLFAYPEQDNLKSFELNKEVSLTWYVEFSVDHWFSKEVFRGEFVVDAR